MPPSKSPAKNGQMTTLGGAETEDLKAPLMQNDGNVSNKYKLEDNVSHAPMPEVNTNMSSKTLSNLTELKNQAEKKNGNKKKQSKEANDTCNCSIF